jgi:hypothetical protein
MKNTPKEYYKCHFTGQTFHYTEFVLAQKGWLAIDGTRRHPISKIGKTINQALTNGLRITHNGKLISIANEQHPHHHIYKQHTQDVRKENNYKFGWLRVDLTKEVYIRTYQSLNMQMPDLENLSLRGSRKSNGSDACLDFLQIKNDRHHREVKIGKYFVDGLVDNIAVEYFGDFFHANPKFYSPKQKILGYTAEQKWQKDSERLKTIEGSGIKVVKVWENDWNIFQQSSHSKLRVEYNNQEFHIMNLEELKKVIFG